MYNLVEPYKPRHPIFTLPRGQRLRELVEKLGEAEFNRRMEIRNDRIRAAERDLCATAYDSNSGQWSRNA